MTSQLQIQGEKTDSRKLEVHIPEILNYIGVFALGTKQARTMKRSFIEFI